MANFTFDENNKLVIVDLPETEVTVQEIVNAVRDWADELNNLDIETFMFASGKQDLGGGVYVGITVVFVEWKLKFADRPGPDWTICQITGGNFVGVDENGDEQVPIEPATYVTVVRTSSSSATLQDLQLTELKYKIESLRESHFAFGDTYYWDPTDGDDANSGNDPTRPVRTYAVAESLVSEETDDSIIIMSQHQPITTPITVTKSNLHIRGAGIATASWEVSGDAITISPNVENVSIEQFGIYSSDNGVVVSSGCDNILLADFRIELAGNHGITASGIRELVLKNGTVAFCGDSNIKSIGSTRLDVYKMLSVQCGGDGIELINCFGSLIHNNCVISSNAGYGINTVNCVATVVANDATIDDNALGKISNMTGVIWGGLDKLAQYAGCVCIDEVNGTSILTYPAGTQAFPVASLADAKTVANKLSLSCIKLLFDTEIVLDESYRGWEFRGTSARGAGVDINGQDVEGCYFTEVAVSGIFPGSDVRGEYFELHNASNFTGVFTDLELVGTITPGSGVTTIVGGGGNPVMNMSIAGADVKFAHFGGVITAINMTDPSTVLNVEFTSGVLVISPSCTAGTILVTGIGTVIDNSMGAIVNCDGLVVPSYLTDIRQSHWNKKVLTKINDNEYKEELYDDDGSVVVRTHTLTKVGDVETRQ